MKAKFSTHWVSSKQPRKQRKYRANAPLHIKHKFLNAHLSKTLKQKYGKRSVPVRKGDEVVVMRGSFKKKMAKISSVDLKRSRVVLENVNRKKKDGTKVSVFFHPSSLRLQTLNLDDRKRIASLEKSKSGGKNVSEKTHDNN